MNLREETEIMTPPTPIDRHVEQWGDLLDKSATLESLLRATSELASSVVSDNETVHDLIRLVNLAKSASVTLSSQIIAFHP